MKPPYVYGTLIAPVAVAANLREFSKRVDRSDCDGMFTSPVCLPASPTIVRGYISTGWVPPVYAQTMRDPVLLYQRAKKAWEDDGDVFPFTQTQVTNALSQCDVSGDHWSVALARNGLQLSPTL